MINIENELNIMDKKRKEELFSTLNSVLNIIEARFVYKMLQLIKENETSGDILEIINLSKGITASKMLKQVSISRGNLYKHLNRLEATGLIEKCRSDVRLPGNADIYYGTSLDLDEAMIENSLSFLDGDTEGKKFLLVLDKLVDKAGNLRI